MLIAKIHRLLIGNYHKSSRKQSIFWFSFSITFAVIYAILGLQQAFSSEYVVQDDARQHVFWMARFLDANLFPNDLIADYFQSVAPVGYSSIYHWFATLGVNPLVLSKLLPLVLGIITTGYCFGVCMQIFPVPITGFMATVMLNQNLWMRNDLVSATARAFTYPLMLAFLYYLLRRSLLPCLVSIGLLGVFYPQCVFICAGILIIRIWDWQTGSFRFSQERERYIFCAVGLGVAFLVMLPYAIKSSEFGPVITVNQARQLPELFSGGRSVFFNDNLFYYFVYGRSGIITANLWAPTTLFTALILPLLCQFRSKFPLLRKLNNEIMLLPQTLLVSLVMFILAHILLFRLYLPSRYTQYSLIIVLVFCAAIALTIILDTILAIGSTQAKGYSLPRQFFAIGFTAFLTITLLFYYPGFIKKFPKTVYVTGNFPQLYEFFQKQPKDTLIASLASEADNLPTFSQRSILAAREYAIPWQFGYYSKFRQRTIELIQAEYSPNLADVKNLIQKYGIDFWLLEAGTFTPDYIKRNKWLKQYLLSNLTEDKLVKLTKDIFQRLQQGNVPALSKVVPSCTVAEIQSFVVLDAKCIGNTSDTPNLPIAS
ncbi:MAG: hypothetical protein QNJ63_24220 [Calothrix sp. MO_192.B10]|nr:hypothetical protein [Calothrix sp. MO_192.B10]